MIFIQLTQQLGSLVNMLSAINKEQYNAKIAHLGNASIGEHSRHIIEILQCAIDGYHIGVVDYINRQRDLRLQNDPVFAKSILEQLKSQVALSDRHLKVFAGQSELVEESNVNSTYFREVVYITDHTIHHLAFIKVGLIDLKLEIVSNDFGLTYSTIKYKTGKDHKLISNSSV